MTVVTVSPKFPVVTPRKSAKRRGWSPAESQVRQYQNRIAFILVQSMRKMRSFFEGIDTTITRDTDRM